MRLKQDKTPTIACDISYWQGELDAQKMYDSGIRACIIRAGYGKTIDKSFITYINKLTKVGIQVGIYWFIYATDVQSCILNAQKCLEVIRPYKGLITLGVWCDWEYDSDKYAGQLNSTQRCLIVEAFLQYMIKNGFEVGIYTNQDYIQSGKFKKEMIEKFPLWIARYSKSIGNYGTFGKGGFPYLWQYTSSGVGSDYGVSSSTIDLDRSYIDTSIKVTENVIDSLQKNTETVKASDNPYIKPKRVIKYKEGQYIMHGDDVKWVQWHLWRFGLFVDENGIPNASEIDGYFGSVSSLALKEAQRRLGLVVDGKCGEKTINMFMNI